jgi:superoxide dismutase, Cu-Zn family
MEIVMQKFLVLGALPIIAACNTMTGDSSASAPVVANAELMQAGQNVGTLTLTQTAGDINMALSVSGLQAGEYGMHFHETGKCDAPDYKTAGAHWNPSGKQHGRQNPSGSHAGDLPNLIATSGSIARIEQRLPGIQLTGGAGLLDTDGTAFIIHAKPDDYKTDPSGNSGDRKICGVLKRV